MALDWMGRGKTESDVARLVARRQYGQAVEALRATFAGRLPDAGQRLRLAALLVLARRGEEAVPLLLAIADESVRTGHLGQGMEMLDRIDTIQPGRPEVATRRASLRAEAEPSRSEAEPVALGSLDDADILDEDAVLADDDIADPSAWAHAIVDTAFGPSAEEKAAARSLEEGLFGAVDEEPAPISDPRAASKTAPARPVSTEQGRPDEILARVQELAGHGVGPSGRPALAPSLFGAHTRARLLALVAGMRLRRFSAGDVILTEGEAGASLFLIARGSAKVFVRSPHGRSFEVGRLEETDFFGEVSVISGRPRTASVVASAPCELLEMGRETLENLLQGRPDAQSLLEEACVARALSPAAAAVRALPKEASRSRERAHAALAAHFGDTQWSLRMRLRLAEVLLKAGNEDDAVAILTSVADALAAADNGEKALAVLQKIASVRRRHVEELCLAPLAKAPKPEKAPEGERHSRLVEAPHGVFRDWLVNMLREVAEDGGTPPVTFH
jgi:CRP-like cAMP-binding protein